MGRDAEGSARMRGLRLNPRAREVAEANRDDLQGIVARTAALDVWDRTLVLQVLAQELRGHRVVHLDADDRPEGWRAFGSLITAMREQAAVDLAPVLTVVELAAHLGVSRGAVLNLRQREQQRPFWLGGRRRETAGIAADDESAAV